MHWQCHWHWQLPVCGDPGPSPADHCQWHCQFQWHWQSVPPASWHCKWHCQCQLEAPPARARARARGGLRRVRVTGSGTGRSANEATASGLIASSTIRKSCFYTVLYSSSIQDYLIRVLYDFYTKIYRLYRFCIGYP